MPAGASQANVLEAWGDLRLERYRRLLLEGRQRQVRFSATAVDARGNASSAAKRTRLVLSGA